MTDTQVVEAPDATADLDPGENRQRTLREALGKRTNRVEALRDDIAGVRHPIVLIAGPERRRDRQARAMQPVSQLPFGERARFLFAAPEISVARKARDQAAAVVMPQHKLPTRGFDVVGGAAAAGRSLDLAARLPMFWIEPGGGQIAHAGPVI